MSKKYVAASGGFGHLSGAMKIYARTLQRLVLLIALTVALVATGFAHRVPSATDAALQAYVLAGGEIADLCADAGGDRFADHRDCPACQLASAADLPPSNIVLRDADVVFVAVVVAPRESRVLRTVLDPARGMRAPPLA